ncbi:copper amine oxidase N-terminal domain-containing protein [Paenibacillus sp. 1011MAR3C5]|nr:copper amine oxidase N-terminal domain-containing protein [Paenibacillus sp. 1011MAR3C5]
MDSRPVYFDVAPQKINGRVMVPLRAIFESMGAVVGWDDSTQTITGKKADIVVTLRLNDTKAVVSGKTVTLDVAATKMEGRTFVPARFVAESFGADVQWDDNRKQVIISTGAAAPEGRYYFVYNSEKVTAQDMASIKLFANKFKQTHNILLDAAQYKTAPQLYDALKTEQKKLGGKVAGVQIFGVAGDVPAFSYVHKMKTIEDNGRWDGVEHNKDEKYVTDFFYSTFKNDSKHLKGDVTVYGIIQENLPISIVPEWPVSRLPLTKGEISKYIGGYDAYRQQIDGKSVPTVVLSAPTQFQDGYAQNDLALFMKRLKDENEFALFKSTSQRIYYKDLAASLAKENKSGAMDLVVNSEGDNEGAKQNKAAFFDRKSVVNLNANHYTTFFWGMAAAKGLDANSIVHDGLAKGKMINPISHTVNATNGGIANYIWTRVPTPEGEQDGDWHDYVAANKELLEETTSPYFFVYTYFEAIQNGKSRLESFHAAKVAYAKLSVSNKSNLGAAFGFENVISLHYLGVADYE